MIRELLVLVLLRYGVQVGPDMLPLELSQSIVNKESFDLKQQLKGN